MAVFVNDTFVKAFLTPSNEIDYQAMNIDLILNRSKMTPILTIDKGF